MLFKNFAYCALTSSVNTSVTTFPVDECGRLPSNTQLGADTFYMTVESSYAVGGFEIVQVTAKSATSGAGNLTVVRAADGSTAASHSSGDIVKHSLASGSIAAIPFLNGNADAHPVTANSHDDEFDGSSTVTWSATPTAANASNINTTRPGHLYLKASGSGAAYVGKVRAVPGSTPFTITAVLKGFTARANYHRGGGIILGPASPTGSSNLLYCGAAFNASIGVQRIVAQFGGTFGSQTSALLPNHWGPTYLKVVVNSSTSVDTFASVDGWAWLPIETAFNPGFTPGVMGLACNEENSGGGQESYFDWFRVT